MNESVDAQLLRLLDDSIEGQYRLLLADEPYIAMRGLDYRAPLNGITLLIAKSFPHKRAVLQAAYRVGRQQDPCQRIVLSKVDLIDAEDERKYKAKLMGFLRTTEKQAILKTYMTFQGGKAKKGRVEIKQKPPFPKFKDHVGAKRPVRQCNLKFEPIMEGKTKRQQQLVFNKEMKKYVDK